MSRFLVIIMSSVSREISKFSLLSPVSHATFFVIFSVSHNIVVICFVSREKLVILSVSRNVLVISFVSRNIFVILFSDLSPVLAMAAFEHNLKYLTHIRNHNLPTSYTLTSLYSYHPATLMMPRRIRDGVSSAHSLASDTSDVTRHRRVPRRKGGQETAISPAGSNARSSRAAARARNQSTSGASSPPASVPKVVTTRLFKRGRLIETAPSNARPAARQQAPPQPLSGLIYSDDDEKDLDAVDDDDEYVENNFSSFPPPAKVRRFRVLGGPQPPDTSNMSSTEETKALARFEKERRRWLDANRNKVAKDNHEANLSTSSPSRAQLRNYSGDQCPTIRLMMLVESQRLLPGHLFRSKETLMIRIAEEANLRHLKVTVMKSSYISYVVGGPNFYVASSFRKDAGWLVTVACCREEDEVLSIPPNAHYFDEGKLRLPFRAKWISYLLRKTVADCPGASYRVMSEVIRDYVNEYAITNNILQDARDHAKKNIFGEAEDNVKYAYALRESLQQKGHVCELIFTSRREVIRTIRAVVIKEELDRRELANEPTLERGQARVEYLNAWFRTHEVELTFFLGMEDGPELKFLTGILIATATSKAQAPFLQDVIQADAAHMAFGKYTFFSAYAGSANQKMVGLGCGILFGNEDKNNWKTFWEFLHKAHPIINQRSKTIITDQDKGSSSSIKEILTEVGLFHCSFHRRQNILRKFGGGKGNTPLTAMWMYNRLMQCNNVSSIQYLRSKYSEKIHPSHLHYLGGIDDEQQYPAARCAMSDDIIMYGLSASSGAESMNRANDSVRRRTATDALNAALLWVQKESDRYERSKADAWKKDRFRSEKPLTPRGMSLMKDIFENCDTALYRITNVTETDTHHFAKIHKYSTPHREYEVKIPIEGQTHGSRFGTCTCGFPRKEGIPCDHMVAIVKVGAIPMLTKVSIMPYWFTREQWQLQFPTEVISPADITLAAMKSNSFKVDNLRYCPEWTVGRKKGRPKKGQRTLGITDHIQNSAKKRKRAQGGTARRRGELEIETILESEEADDIEQLLQADGVEAEIKGTIGIAD